MVATEPLLARPLMTPVALGLARNHLNPILPEVLGAAAALPVHHTIHVILLGKARTNRVRLHKHGGQGRRAHIDVQK